MTSMLPIPAPGSRSIAGVADDLFRATRGESPNLPRVSSSVLIVIDGLGAISLRGHAGHARALSASMTKRSISSAVFPSTTAAGLTSMFTGVYPGEHGFVGYTVRSRNGALSLLSGWEHSREDPVQWQPVPTVFERAGAAGHPSFAVGLAEYARSGFTQAILRGATYVAAKTPAERVARAYELAAQNPGAFIYCYLPEVDKAGHHDGIASAKWVAALEDIDAALRVRIPAKVGVVVTADHGMVDVPSHRQHVIDEGDSRLEGVQLIAGEPRMLHVYFEPDRDPDAALSQWRVGCEGIADVVTRTDAIAQGVFGARVTDAASARIGDILVAARGNRALYDGTAPDQSSRGMVGQHGSLTPEEVMVPHLQWGAFAG